MRKYKLKEMNVGIFHFAQWRLLPWYSCNLCVNKCCAYRSFSWLFLHVSFMISMETP